MDSFLWVFAGLAAGFWGILLLRRGGLLLGCAVTVVAGACLGHPYWNVSLGSVPVTLDRLLLVGLAVYALCAGRTSAVAGRPWSKSDFILLALLGLLTLSTFAHDWRYQENLPLGRLLFFYYVPAALYVIVRRAPLSAKAVWGTLLVWTALAGYLAVTALCETRGWWGLVWPRFIVSAVYPEFLGRGRGPFLNPVSNGIYLTCGLGAACALAAGAATRGRRLWAVGCAVASLAGCYLTLTRSVWLGAAVAVALAVVLLPRTWRRPTLFAGGLAAVVVFVFAWGGLHQFKRDKFVSETEMAQSASLRPILAAVAWRMFQDRPLAGCGLGQYLKYSGDYLGRDSSLPLEKARPYVQHNVLLSLLTETGLLGAGTFLVLCIAWLRDAWRLWRNPLAPDWARRQAWLFAVVLAAYLVNGQFHDVSIVPAANSLLFTLAGLVQSLRDDVQSGRSMVATTAQPQFALR